MRLIAANHWFADGNKRTALNTTEMFYLFNGHAFETGEDLRSLVKLFSVRENIFDEDVAVEYLATRTEEDVIDWDEITADQFIAALIITKIGESISEISGDSRPHTSEKGG